MIKVDLEGAHLPIHQLQIHFKDSILPIIPEDEEYDEDIRDGLDVVGPDQCSGINSSQLDLDLHVSVG